LWGREDTERQQTARELKASGLSYGKVGEIMGVSRQRAQQLCLPFNEYRRKEFLAAQECAKCKSKDKLQIAHVDYRDNLFLVMCNECHKKFDSKIKIIVDTA